MLWDDVIDNDALISVEGGKHRVEVECSFLIVSGSWGNALCTETLFSPIPLSRSSLGGKAPVSTVNLD